MLNLTTTTKRLKIGKIKLYELLKITGIEPVVKGRSKFITDEQFGLLQQAFVLISSFKMNQIELKTNPKMNPRRNQNKILSWSRR